MTDQYKELYQSFEWLVPNNFNIAEACCHRWAYNNHDLKQTAVFFEDQVGQLTMYPYRQLSEKVNKLANALTKMGVQAQDRVLISLSHSAESIVSVLAVLTLGGIAVPLTAQLTGPQYLRRAQDSQSKVAIVDKHTIQPLMSSLDNHTTISQIIGINTSEERVIDMDTLLARQSSQFTTQVLAANTPALILYPETDDENIKGTVLSHKSLIGNLPGFVASQNWYPKNDDTFWTSYDWNSAYGLINAVLPAMYFGHSIVGCPSGRTIPRLFKLLEHYQITNILTSQAELLRIKQGLDQDNSIVENAELAIRCIACPSDDKTTELNNWAQRVFNTHINGITAPIGLGYILGDSYERWPENHEKGSIGRVYPGRSYTILDKVGKEVKQGQIGELHLNTKDIHGYTDPAISTQYWQHAQLHTTIASDGRIPTGILATEASNHDIKPLK